MTEFVPINLALLEPGKAYRYLDSSAPRYGTSTITLLVGGRPKGPAIPLEEVGSVPSTRTRTLGVFLSIPFPWRDRERRGPVPSGKRRDRYCLSELPWAFRGASMTAKLRRFEDLVPGKAYKPSGSFSKRFAEPFLVLDRPAQGEVRCLLGDGSTATLFGPGLDAFIELTT